MPLSRAQMPQISILASKDTQLYPRTQKSQKTPFKRVSAYAPLSPGISIRAYAHTYIRVYIIICPRIRLSPHLCICIYLCRHLCSYMQLYSHMRICVYQDAHLEAGMYRGKAMCISMCRPMCSYIQLCLCAGVCRGMDRDR